MSGRLRPGSDGCRSCLPSLKQMSCHGSWDCLTDTAGLPYFRRLRRTTDAEQARMVNQGDGIVDARSLKPDGLAWTWWRGDPLPRLEPIPGLTMGLAQPDDVLAEVNRVTPGEVRRRVQTGNRPYVASAQGTPVAYGWVAT